MPQIYDLCLYDPSRLHWLSNGMIEQNDVQEIKSENSVM